MDFSPPAEASTPISHRRLSASSAALVLAVVFALAPAVGVTGEDVLQDTLKSAVVSVGAFVAILTLACTARRDTLVVWHAALMLPALLAIFALVSTGWSHPYLASVECVRWVVVCVLAFTATQIAAAGGLRVLASGIGVGTVIASAWAALQFYAGASPFPQGPHPGSTFLNRNFFAEYAVCALPFVLGLLFTSVRRGGSVAWAAGAAVVALAICMTGTRSALTAMWLQLLVLPALLYRSQRNRAAQAWSRWTTAAVVATFIGLTLGAGLIPCGDASILHEGRGTNALQRAFKRTASVSTSDDSMSVRYRLWRATGRMIAANPLSGVGAGAWENKVPLFQDGDEAMELDFYAHNELLQLLAEYGLVGWFCLVALGVSMARWCGRARQDMDAWRISLLAALLSIAVVGSAGFPLHLAGTSALFSVILGSLAAMDWPSLRAFTPSQRLIASARAAAALALGLSVLVTIQATRAEEDLVGSVKLAAAIAQSRNPGAAPLQPLKDAAGAMLEEGMRLNPDYRKLIPLAAAQFSRFGDYRTAISAWETTLASRPNVAVLHVSAARAYLALGEFDRARDHAERAMLLAPRATSVRELAQELALRTSGDHSRKAE